MKIEYIKEASLDCPLIRIFGNEPDRVQELNIVLKKLAEGKVNEIALRQLMGFECIDSCTLTARLVNQNLGVVKIKKDSNDFEWSLNKNAWLNVVGFLKPFCLPDSGNSFQWVDETSDISVLISRDGQR